MLTVCLGEDSKESLFYARGCLEGIKGSKNNVYYKSLYNLISMISIMMLRAANFAQKKIKKSVTSLMVAP